MRSLLGMLFCVGLCTAVLYSADSILQYVLPGAFLKPWVVELLAKDVPFLATTGGLTRLAGSSPNVSES